VDISYLDFMDQLYAKYPELRGWATRRHPKPEGTLPHRSDVHLKRKGRWVTKTVLCEKRYEA
jgi:hypothetical protein